MPLQCSGQAIKIDFTGHLEIITPLVRIAMLPPHNGDGNFIGFLSVLGSGTVVISASQEFAVFFPLSSLFLASSSP